ncbi:type II toxin-antitoxin system VapC family toxin [Nostoc sp.]|uniref:type II toxin-antitoxin system VapC family toxin n=1 Tax=Nostoc sp. TaxID=1180 RepID=UPI002FF4910D
MRVLIDTNIVLDFLQEREPFVQDAARLFERIDAGEVQGFIAATTITNIYYVVRRAAGVKVAQDAIIQVLTDLHICPVDRTILEQAIALNFRDFEDAVQLCLWNDTWGRCSYNSLCPWFCRCSDSSDVT